MEKTETSDVEQDHAEVKAALHNLVRAVSWQTKAEVLAAVAVAHGLLGYDVKDDG